MKLKPIDQQVMVITGGTSGIGLVTARLAARRGAKLVLAARNEAALRELQEELTASGTEAVCVLADVANEHEVERIAATALEQFGRVDTWVNNAGVSVYGKIEDVPIEDHRRLFETNFWGVVYGSLTAAKVLRENGGALINIGSVLSDRAIPLQGMYSASKHAVKGFTDALRMELEEEGSPVIVTLIKPSTIDTPYAKHAKNYMEGEVKRAGPVYAPDVVARTILYCAQHPQRDVTVGSGGRILSAVAHAAPRLTDRIMESTLFASQMKEEPNMEEEDSLYGPAGEDLEERGNYEGYVQRNSFYTAARLHPVLSGVAAIGIALAITALVLGTTGRLPRARRFAGLLPVGILKARRSLRRARGFYPDRLERLTARANRVAARRARGMRHAFEEWADRSPFMRSAMR